AVLGLGLAHDARERIELSAAEPELAVQRLTGRQLGNKPRRRMNRPAAAKMQSRAVPERAHAVELFADQIFGRIAVRTELVGEEQRRRRGRPGKASIDKKRNENRGDRGARRLKNPG